MITTTLDLCGLPANFVGSPLEAFLKSQGYTREIHYNIRIIYHGLCPFTISPSTSCQYMRPGSLGEDVFREVAAAMLRKFAERDHQPKIFQKVSNVNPSARLAPPRSTSTKRVKWEEKLDDTRYEHGDPADFFKAFKTLPELNCEHVVKKGDCTKAGIMRQARFSFLLEKKGDKVVATWPDLKLAIIGHSCDHVADTELNDMIVFSGWVEKCDGRPFLCSMIFVSSEKRMIVGRGTVTLKTQQALVN